MITEYPVHVLREDSPDGGRGSTDLWNGWILNQK